VKWKLALGLALSALFLWLAVRGAPLREVAATLAAARYWLMVPVIVLTMLAYFVRAWRWQYLLAGVRRIPLGPLWASVMIGFMGNNVLPARLGELLRAHSLGRAAGVSRSACLASIVVERFFDILVLLAIFGVILITRGLPSDVRAWGGILLALVAPVLLLFVLFELRPEPFLRLVDRFLPARLSPRVRQAALNFRDGLGSFRRPAPLLWSLALSLVMWGLLVGVSLLTLEAVGLQLPPDAAVVVLVVMAIGTMIPAAPGYIGTLQYAGTLALLPYGVEKSAALSFTVLYHAGQWLPVTAVGLVYFMRENMSLSRIGDLRSAPPGSGRDAGAGTARETGAGTARDTGAGTARETGAGAARETGAGTRSGTGAGTGSGTGPVSGRDSGRGPERETGRGAPTDGVRRGGDGSSGLPPRGGR